MSKPAVSVKDLLHRHWKELNRPRVGKRVHVIVWDHVLAGMLMRQLARLRLHLEVHTWSVGLEVDGIDE